MLEARDVGHALRDLRGERSRAAVAEEAEIDAEDLAGYEEGLDMPLRDELSRLVEALGIAEPELDLRVIDHWRRRIGKVLPHSLEGKRLEVFEHLEVIGIRMKSLVKTLDDITLLQQSR